jgi:general secretion pathway protein I
MMPAPRDAGFTLIEALVAFAILGLSFAVLIPLFRDTAAKTEHAALTRTAASLAESVMAQAGSLAPLAAGEASGDEGSFHWLRRITPLPQLLGDNPYRLSGYQVTVAVSWGDRAPADTVSLETVRLGPKL